MCAYELVTSSPPMLCWTSTFTPSPPPFSVASTTTPSAIDITGVPLPGIEVDAVVVRRAAGAGGVTRTEARGALLGGQHRPDDEVGLDDRDVAEPRDLREEGRRRGLDGVALDRHGLELGLVRDLDGLRGQRDRVLDRGVDGGARLGVGRRDGEGRHARRDQHARREGHRDHRERRPQRSAARGSVRARAGDEGRAARVRARDEAEGFGAARRP